MRFNFAPNSLTTSAVQSVVELITEGLEPHHDFFARHVVDVSNHQLVAIGP